MKYTIRILSIIRTGTRAASEAVLNSQADMGYFSTPVGRIGVVEVCHWFLSTKARRSSLPGFSAMMLAVHERDDTGEFKDDVRHELTDGDGLLAGYCIYHDSDGGATMSFDSFLSAWGLERKYPSLEGDQPIDAAISAAEGAE